MRMRTGGRAAAASLVLVATALAGSACSGGDATVPTTSATPTADPSGTAGATEIGRAHG